SPGREDVLPASGGGIAVVDDDGDAVVLVEYGVADARGQTVVPEAAVAHHADRTPRPGDIESRRAGRAQTVAHSGVADIERRQAGEDMAADVAGHMQRPQLPLHQLHRGEDRPFRAAGTETRWPWRHLFLQLLEDDRLGFDLARRREQA